MDKATRASGDDASVSDPIELGELRIDVERAEIQMRWRRIDAQPRLVQLLGFLARESPRVLSRRELIEKLWPATAVTDHALTVRTIFQVDQQLRPGCVFGLFLAPIPNVAFALEHVGQVLLELGKRHVDMRTLDAYRISNAR